MLQPIEGNRDEQVNNLNEKVDFGQTNVGNDNRVESAEEEMKIADRRLNSDDKPYNAIEHRLGQKVLPDKDKDQNTNKENQLLQEDKFSGSKDLNLSKNIPKSGEIEDEHHIRIGSPKSNNDTQSSRQKQNGDKFDVNDLSFFDTPVHRQTHSMVRNISLSESDKALNGQNEQPSTSNKLSGDEKKLKEEPVVVDKLSPEFEKDQKIANELKDNGENTNATELLPGKVTSRLSAASKKNDSRAISDNSSNELPDDTMSKKFDDTLQNNKEEVMKKNQPSDQLSNGEDEAIGKERKGQDIISAKLREEARVNILKVNSRSGSFEPHENLVEDGDQKISVISKPTDSIKGADETLDGKSRRVEDIRNGIDSKLGDTRSSSKYETDFESADNTEEIEKLQTSFGSRDPEHDEKINPIHEGKPIDKSKTAEDAKSVNDLKEKTLLVEELSDAEIFSRENPKSLILRVPKENQKYHTQSQHNANGKESLKPAKAQYQAHTEVKTFTQETTKIETIITSESQRTNKMSSVEHRTNTHSANKLDKQTKDTNPYFTGRLPSLCLENDHETSGKYREIDNKQDTITDQDVKLPGTMTINHTDPDAVSEHRSTSRILELIQEINAPAQRFLITKERPLTPKTPSNKRAFSDNDDAFISSSEHSEKSDDKQAHHINDERSLRQTDFSKPRGVNEASHQQNETFLTTSEFPIASENAKNSKENDKDYGIENSNMTMRDVDLVTSSMMNEYVSHEAPASAKFDGFPHIKEISEYKKVNKLAETPRGREGDGISPIRETQMKLPTLNQQVPTKQTPHREKSNASEKQTEKSSTVIPNHFQESTHSGVDNVVNPNKRSSSENELKAVVASAKRAYGQDTITSSSSVLPPLTREATLESEISTTKQDNDESMTSLQTSRVTDDSSHVLICSNCLNQDGNIESAGFCRECQQYLCGNCITLHKRSTDTKRHEIMVAYCVKELEVNQYVKATGYCVDCQHFLCMKCVIRHTGYRANRHHRIIQRTFLSKPSKRTNRASKTEVHVSFDQNTKTPKDDKPLEDQKRLQSRKMLLRDIGQGNPYRVNFVQVPQSLYPGPNKNLAVSYADNPKWPQASVPKMPYLVKPKSLQERLLQTPYVMHRKSALYTNTKSAFDPQRIKLKMLQDKFGSKSGISGRTGRRKEEGLFTVRREKKSDTTSLPDINSKPIKVQANKTEKHVSKPSRVKRVKLLKEHCVSIPFPSGERQSDILAMTCLPNGSILIADKQNNNVKLYSKQFKFKAIVQFNNRLADLCASNLCPVDIYVATQKHVFEITTMKKGLEVQRKIKVDIKRIEGVTCWKYGIAVIHKKTNLTWELKLMDYRGNSKSKLEIVNPFTQEIDDAPVCYITTIKGGKRVILTDTRNACMICTDVTSRCVLYETTLPENCTPSYVTSDNQHNVFISCVDKIQQLSKEGNNLGAVITTPEGVKSFGCILYNRSHDVLYVQTSRDTISVYQVF